MNYWDDARVLDQLAWESRLADYPRGLNRALIANQANGVAPYTEEEVQANGINVNVNFLEMTTLTHSARMQFLQGFVKPGKYFTATTDYGPAHRRQAWNTVVTREINRTLKKSTAYFEAIRAEFALLVLHGIAPKVWENRHRLIPRPIGIEDVLLPSGTLIGFENVPRMILYRSFTGMELQNLVFGAGKPDPAWNTSLVKRCIEYVDQQAQNMQYNNWPALYAPEKMAERMKGSNAFYVSDQLPTIDCFDFYVYVDDGKRSGWVRRIILDAWGSPVSDGAKGYTMSRNSKLGSLGEINRDDFLYNSKRRMVANDISQIASFNYADLSAVAPFRYHSVRSLGYLLYALCHIQNRTRCSFLEAVFESLMMLMRVKSLDDVQRALTISLGNRKFIDDSFEFVPPGERWQVNERLAQLGLAENQRLIEKHAANFTPTTDFKDRTEKTKFQVMAELNVTQALVSAALQQAYQYKTYEYEELFRRACRKDSEDAKVRNFQARCVQQGVPPNMLIAEKWNIEPERIMGGGNKTMELAIAEQLMQWRPLYDPASQRAILRDATSALTDDPARAEALVPEEPQVSNSVHAAQGDSASIMMGLPVKPIEGINETEYIEALMANMAILIQKVQQGASQPTPEMLAGLNNMAAHVTEHIQILVPNEAEAKRVAAYQKQLGVIMAIVKQLEQQLIKSMQDAGQNGNGGVDPKDIAKIQGEQIKAQAKADNMRESHAQRTQQRQVQFEQKLQQQSLQTAAEIQRDAERTAAEIQRDAVKTAAEITQEAQRPKPQSKE